MVRRTRTTKIVESQSTVVSGTILTAPRGKDFILWKAAE